MGHDPEVPADDGIRKAPENQVEVGPLLLNDGRDGRDAQTTADECKERVEMSDFEISRQMLKPVAQ